MPHLLIRAKFQDYSKFHPVYTQHAAARQAAGSKGVRLFRSAADPNEVVALFEWDDLDRARQFAQSDDLRQAMQRAGVAGRMSTSSTRSSRRRRDRVLRSIKVPRAMKTGTHSGPHRRNP